MANPEVPRLSEDFRDFLIEAKQHGYGMPDAQLVPEPENSGAKVIVYERAPYLYVDNFVGGSPYLGYEHVSALVDGVYTPVWGMSYFERFRGDITPQQLGGTLGKVLASPDTSFPIRGPFEWEEDDMHYRLQPFSGSEKLEAFEAKETISRINPLGNKQTLYVAEFAGKLVNRSVALEATNPTWLAND